MEVEDPRLAPLEDLHEFDAACMLLRLANEHGNLRIPNASDSSAVYGNPLMFGDFTGCFVVLSWPTKWGVPSIKRFFSYCVL